MNSPIARLDLNDLFKGLVMAVFAAVITVFYGLVNQPDFSFFSADWGMILNDVVKVSFTAGLAYITKNMFTDQSGNFAGIEVK